MVANTLPAVSIPAVGDLVEYQGSLAYYHDIVFVVIRVTSCGRLTLAYPQYLDEWVIRRVRPSSVRPVCDQQALF